MKSICVAFAALLTAALAHGQATPQYLPANGCSTATNAQIRCATMNTNIFAADGDSMTAGLEGVVQMDSYPSILRGLVGTDVVNFGTGGTTSTQIAVKAGATNSSIQLSSGNIPACSTPSCGSIQVAFPIGYEPTANSSTGGGVATVTGTIQASANIHGSVILAALYVGTSTWAISAGTLTINGLVLVASSGVSLGAGTVVTVSGINGATGCGDVNGPHTLTGGTVSTIAFSTSCTGSGTGGVVSVYTFTPDAYTPGATISGTPTYVPDQSCPSCSILAWPGRNNLFSNGSYPFGLAVVQGSVQAIAVLVPSNRQFIVLPVLPNNTSAEWSSGGNYATLQTYAAWLASTYPNSYVDVWTALQNASNSALPTDVQDVANGGIPTSLRDVTAVCTLHGGISNSVTSLQLDCTAGVPAALQVITLDAGNSAASENINCSSVTGSSNPYSLSSCTRGFGGGTPFSHSNGVAVQQDDGTHLNAAGYAVVAQAIAAKLGYAAGTASISGAQLDRANTLGGRGVQLQTVGGDATAGIGWRYGNTPTVQNYTGTVPLGTLAGSQALCYNAVPNGYGLDLWYQPLSTVSSYCLTLGINGLALYHALGSAASNPFLSFFTGPDFTLARTGFTFNQQTLFTYVLNEFANGADSTNTIDFGAGLTADQLKTFQWNDRNRACLWQDNVLADGTRRIFDCKSSPTLYRVIMIANGATTINSGPGANAVNINSTANSGTTGMLFWSGGASPAIVGGVNGTGRGSFNGGLDISGGTNGLKLKDQGTCTMASGACSAQSLGHTYVAIPVCLGNWTGAGTLAGTLQMPATTTTVTPTSSLGTDTAVVAWACFGQ